MVNLTSRRNRHRIPVDNAITSNSWAWGNWIKNGFRKASEIDFTRNGICTTHKTVTVFGDIYCCVSRSPYAIHRMRRLIERLYRESGERAPIFVSIRVYRRIEAIEHG